MKRFTKAQTGICILISAFIAVMLYIILYKNVPMVYAINDDTTMRDIASGAMTGEPDGHLIFIKYVFGFLLSRMYLLLPGFDWYGIIMGGAIPMLCLTLFLYRGLSDIRGIRNKVLYAVLVLAVFICAAVQHVAIFEWTVSAGLLGATGVYLFYTSSEENKLKNYLEEILSVFLFLITFCIRSKIFYMLVPIAGICYLYKYVRVEKGEKLRLFVRHIWYWPAVFLGCGLIMLIESNAYQDEDWKKYLEYNQYRSEIYDYYWIPSYAENEEFYDSIDMTEEDVELLIQYSLLPLDGVYEYKMKALAEYAGETAASQKSVAERLVSGIQSVYTDFENGEYAPLNGILLITLVAALLICFGKKSSQFYLLLACGGIWLLLWCYLGFKGRIVNRVSFVMYLYLLFTAAAVLYRELAERMSEQKAGSERRTFLLVLGCCLCFCGISLLEWKEVKVTASRIWELNQEQTQIYQYMQAHPEHIYFLHTDSMAPYTDNFTLRRNAEVGNWVLLGGWQSFAPVEVRRRELLGVADAAEAIYRQEHVYVCSRFNMAHMEAFFKKEYGSCHSTLLDTIDYTNYFYTIEKFGE